MATQEQVTDRAFGRLEANVENLQTSVGELRAELRETNGRIDQTNGRIDQMNSKIDRLFYAIIGIGGGIVAAIVALVLRGA